MRRSPLPKAPTGRSAWSLQACEHVVAIFTCNGQFHRLTEPCNRMSKGGKRAVRIPTTRLLFRGEKLGEVIAGMFPFPVVGEQPDPEPGDDIGSRSSEHILDFPRLVGTDRFDAYPILVCAGVEAVQCLSPSPPHAGTHCNADSVPREQ